MKYQPASDYADESATELDREPHWSSLRKSLAEMTRRSSRDLPARAQTVRPELPSPGLPPRLPPAVQRSAANQTPSAPLPVIASPDPAAALAPAAPAAPVYMLPFYSYAESQTQYGLDTERVVPLPMSSLRPSWEELLVKAWQRFAAPACGMIAGLIFVVGYLAYSGQRGAAIASSASPVAPMVMPAIAMTADAPNEDDVAPAPAMIPTVSEIHTAKPAKATKRPAKRVASSSTKRRPIRLNDSTPLGDLRPSRSR